jgi:hypothetical protein
MVFKSGHLLFHRLNHRYPLTAIAMIEHQNVLYRPVKMHGNEGYLLVELG